MLSGYIAFALSFMNDLYEGNELLKQRAIDEYKAGFDLVDIVEASNKWIEENL